MRSKTFFSSAINIGVVNFWLFVLRIVISLMMLTHGLPKFQKLLAGNVHFSDPFGIGAAASLSLAVFAEVGCSILLIAGLLSRLATLPLIITMLVAIFYEHADDAFGKKELAILYLIIFIGLLITGPGKYSIDGMIGSKHKSRK